MLLFSWNNQLFHIILCHPADESSADIVLYWSGVRVILTGAVRQLYLAWIQAVTAFECPVTTWIKFVCNFKSYELLFFSLRVNRQRIWNKIMVSQQNLLVYNNFKIRLFICSNVKTYLVGIVFLIATINRSWVRLLPVFHLHPTYIINGSYFVL